MPTRTSKFLPRILVDYSTEFKPGDQVVLEATTEACLFCISTVPMVFKKQIQ